MATLDTTTVNNNIDLDNYKFTNIDDECVKNEQTLSISAFGTTTVYSSLIALATRAQQLILLEPGTVPTAVDMGVGIRNYIMELSDVQTLDEIHANIVRQFSKYMPSNVIKDISVQAILDSTNSWHLYIKIFINKTDAEFKNNQFVLSFTQDTRSSISSEIYV